VALLAFFVALRWGPRPHRWRSPWTDSPRCPRCAWLRSRPLSCPVPGPGRGRPARRGLPPLPERWAGQRHRREPAGRLAGAGRPRAGAGRPRRRPVRRPPHACSTRLPDSMGITERTALPASPLLW